MTKIIEPTELRNDIPESLREWVLLVLSSGAEVKAYNVGYDYIKQITEDKIDLRFQIEEMNIGSSLGIDVLRKLIRVK